MLDIAILGERIRTLRREHGLTQNAIFICAMVKTAGSSALPWRPQNRRMPHAEQ